MTQTPAIKTPWVRHILGYSTLNELQHCILCGVSIAPHILGHLPEGVVYEHDGRLLLIEPLGTIVSCHNKGEL